MVRAETGFVKEQYKLILRWERRYTAGHDPETSKTIYKNVLGRTQEEAKEKLNAAIKETQSLDLQKLYKKLLTKDWVDRLEAKGQPKGLSAKTVRNIHQILSSALKLAQEQRIILTNPAEGRALPKVEHREMKTLPVEQLASFLREAKESGVFELYYVELATGLRRGELLGLKWEDLDLDRGDLRVRRQISCINGEVVEAPLKTKNAHRTLPLAEDAVSVLLKQKKKRVAAHGCFRHPAAAPSPGQRPAHAPPGAETGGTAQSQVP